MWYVCDGLHAVLYVQVSCLVVRGCAVSRRHIDVCNCDVFSVVVNVMLSLMSVMSPPLRGPTEGACSMAVPAMSTRPRTSALRMHSTHPAIRNANNR